MVVMSLPSHINVWMDSFSVQLWTCSNYHWSLKQNLTFSCKHGNVVAMIWDPEHFGCLHLVTSTGQYLQYTWTSVTNHSHGQTSHDPANVFVINGSKLQKVPQTPGKIIIWLYFRAFWNHSIALKKSVENLIHTVFIGSVESDTIKLDQNLLAA